jgi:hypothetical protein
MKRTLQTICFCLLVTLGTAQVNDLSDPQFLARLGAAGAPVGFPLDDAETYTDNGALSALNGGWNFAGAYADRANLTGIQASDTSETYSDAASLNALNGGLGWSGAYNDHNGGPEPGIHASDDMESYTDAASLNSLNGGRTWVTPWAGAYVDR